MKKKLYSVTCEILIDAESPADALQKADELLSGKNSDLDMNYLISSAEEDESFDSLKDLRK